MRSITLLFIFTFLLTTAVPAQDQNPLRGRSSEPIEPYQVIGNIYYVGAVNISSHIIVTPEGLILLDTGTAEMLPGIRTNIEKLDYTLKDVKIILSSHAHWDHVEGHAAMKELTGAQVMAVGEDAAAIGSGIDSSAAGAQGWNPVRVDRVLEDLDTISLGGVTMQAHLTPGHTKGTTTWTTTVEESGKSYRVVFVGGTGINRGVNLLNNTRYPGIIEDYAQTFRVLKELKGEVFLAQHPSMYGMDDKLERLKTGAAKNPFIDPGGYRYFVEKEEGYYLKQLEEERSASR
ncbi:MAG: subclass B3 metallo-beta-lactamase [Acidobacteriota bacterium]|nr:subclass B3 metallo-beta-lactamase [Acidobacteriota bacterium]